MSGELAKALVAAQAEMPAVKPDATNPHFRSAFVSLDHLIASTRGVLNKHGLAIVQSPSHIDGSPALSTTLYHESGESTTDVMPLILGGSDMQKLGAALTYARRYAWAAALGICADEDDDGNTASAPTGASKPAVAKRQEQSTPEAGGGSASTAPPASPPDGDGTMFFPPEPAQGFDVPAGDRTEAQAKMLHHLLPKLVKAGALTDDGFVAMAHDNGASGDGVNACIDTLSKVGASALISRLKDIEKQQVAA